MLREGLGLVAPTPVAVSITSGDFAYLESAATARDKFRGYATRTDSWGRGFVDRPTLVGLLGEHAWCAFLNKQLGTRLMVDLELRPRGDGGVDINALGLTIDVKTRVSGERYLVRRINDRKEILPLDAEYYAFAKVVSNKEVLLLGWTDRLSMTMSSKLLPSPTKSPHWNLDIPETELEQPSALCLRARARMSA